jgi:hypothetical protein
VAAALGLAASPTFAVMALASGLSGGHGAEMMGGAAHASPLDGMTVMYLLMSVFHAGPWLEQRRRRLPSE